MNKYEHMPTNRSFGISFAVIFFLIEIFSFAVHNKLYSSLFYVSIILLVISIFAPSFFTPFNYVWFHFGLILHAIASVISLAVIFYFLITFTGLLMRFFGKRPLIVGYDQDIPTYWINRAPSDQPGKSMSNQF